MTNITILKKENDALREYNEDVFKKWVKAEREKEILLKELKNKGTQKEMLIL